MTTVQEREELLERLGLDGQNTAALGRLLNTGNVAEAKEREDGVMERRSGSSRTRSAGTPPFWCCRTAATWNSS